ncbi:MAG TPA: hypothetical protein PKN04_12940 [bacterium]|nr:hypothetical protein [bacterium]HNT66681.1 hypothetical protein [bacterium]HOX87026.1 hypothetical protein [bacterium]HPG46357.1 hypothetical protein [bacterium]HPM98729.1 hypothetical protein [bacterium]
MKPIFNKKDLEKISRVLRVEYKDKGNNYRYLIEQPDNTNHLSLEIYPDIMIGERQGNLITVYTPNSHLQLHFCTGYVVSEMLGEVTFVGECGDRLSGLTIERGGGCSLYANVDSRLLSGDFTQLGPEVMLSGVALSLVEQVLPKSSPK